jgi:hypothetical protein
MLEEIRGLPPHVVGLRATGNITKEHYDQVFVPAVDKVAEKYKEVNLLLLLETDLSDFSGGAYVKDILTGFEHLSKWNRIAVVTDQKWVEKATDMFSVIAPGEYLGFEISEIEKAKQWVEEVV